MVLTPPPVAPDPGPAVTPRPASLAPLRRVLVVGVTGAGKTSGARRVADLIGAPFHELDVLAIGPQWSTRPSFAAEVDRLLAEPAWVFDSYGYPEVRDALWAAADTILWLDYPLRVVLPRVLRRSLARSASGDQIFGGNRESWSDWLSRDHPVWWSLATFRTRRDDLFHRSLAPLAQHLRTVRLISPREFERWLADRQELAVLTAPRRD